MFYPYDQPTSYGFGGFAPEGTGDGFVDPERVKAFDVDDIEGLDDTYVVFIEGHPENVVEIFQHDYPDAVNTGDYEMEHFLTIHPANEPIDVEILPMKNIAKPSNWICVLTAANQVEIYQLNDGALMTTIGGPPDIAGEARFLDIDDLNYKIHIMQDSPMVTVYYYDPD